MYKVNEEHVVYKNKVWLVTGYSCTDKEDYTKEWLPDVITLELTDVDTKEKETVSFKFGGRIVWKKPELQSMLDVKKAQLKRLEKEEKALKDEIDELIKDLKALGEQR